MFNLHKFMAFENRDPFALRAEQLGEEGQVLSDWDRFARGEYLRLAVEEEPDDMQVCCWGSETMGARGMWLGPGGGGGEAGGCICQVQSVYLSASSGHSQLNPYHEE